jgi:hypothetical protein
MESVGFTSLFLQEFSSITRATIAALELMPSWIKPHDTGLILGVNLLRLIGYKAAPNRTLKRVDAPSRVLDLL